MSSDGISLPANDKSSRHKPDAEGKPENISVSPAPPIGNSNPKGSDQHTQIETPMRDWLDKAHLIVLIATFLAAIAAAYEAGRLANLTRTAISHADDIARGQIIATGFALKKAEDANTLAKATAERQSVDTASALALSKQAGDAAAKAVETNIAAERARIFVVGMRIGRSGDKDPNPKISFQIANLGKTSALITGVL
jgi:hypothetical protein